MPWALHGDAARDLGLVCLPMGIQKVDAAVVDKITAICREILAPMVRSDGGEMFLVGIKNGQIHLHLGGACAGCPGAAITREKMLTPPLRAIAADFAVLVTTGWQVPSGAVRL